MCFLRLYFFFVKIKLLRLEIKGKPEVSKMLNLINLRRFQRFEVKKDFLRWILTTKDIWGILYLFPFFWTVDNVLYIKLLTLYLRQE